MMTAIKSTLKRIPLARYAYAQVRGWHDKSQGRTLFENHDLYVRALYQKGNGTAVLRTHDGLSITIRQNLCDARIVREIFFERPYLRHVALPSRPIIVDIGGYIGDFSIYAVKYLDAGRVIVYEPAAENFKILSRNIDDNDYGDRITAVNKAVGSSDEIVLNVQKQQGDEVHVSAYWYQEAEQRKIASITLPDLFEAHRLDKVDLLKIDCEGGEYDIFPEVPDHVFDRIENIAFEYHVVDAFESKLRRVSERLSSAGYALRKDRNIITASRAR